LRQKKTQLIHKIYFGGVWDNFKVKSCIETPRRHPKMVQRKKKVLTSVSTFFSQKDSYDLFL
jgi:hypothetical protein